MDVSYSNLVVDGANRYVISKFRRELESETEKISNLIGFKIIQPKSKKHINNASDDDILHDESKEITVEFDKAHPQHPPKDNSIDDDKKDDDDDLEISDDDDLLYAAPNRMNSRNQQIYKALEKDKHVASVLRMNVEWCWAHKISLLIQAVLMKEGIEAIYTTLRTVAKFINSSSLVHKLYITEAELLETGGIDIGNLPRPHEIRWQYALELAEKVIKYSHVISRLVNDVASEKYIVSDNALDQALKLQHTLTPVFWGKIAYCYVFIYIYLYLFIVFMLIYILYIYLWCLYVI